MAKQTTPTFMDAIIRDVARNTRQARLDHRKQLKKDLEGKRIAELEKKLEKLHKQERLAQTQRESKQIQKTIKELVLAAKFEVAEQANTELVEYISVLSNILEHTLGIDDTIAFDSLRVKLKYPSFNPPQELTITPLPPKEEDFLKQVKPMGLVENALGLSGRYKREMQAARKQYTEAMQAHKALIGEKKDKLEQLRAEYGANRQAFFQKVKQRDQEVSYLEAGYAKGESSAVIGYTAMVLERSEYPGGFPQTFRLAYISESKEMVIDYELPSVEVVPPMLEHKYNKTKDTFEQKPRKPAEIKTIYQDVVAAITLRTIHEVLEADQGDHIQMVVFNGFVTTIDPAIGKDVRPYLVSVRTTKEKFSEINLKRVDKNVCLRNLGAQVSPRPDEKLAVKPVIEFDMVDKRFIEQGDILSGLDTRPNLMDLNPSEFETLVSNLFTKMGLETKLTRSSKDGGVDAVAFDTRPILGGKVVIQAKRYKNTVGVSAVRDLYGTMLNEGASKGIIVATSSYGPDAYDFSKDKPLELIDGGGLLYLLEQVGIKAKIIMPQE